MDPVKVGVKELRARLKEFLELGQPVIVRNHRRDVAILLPTELSYWPSREEVDKSLARMKDMLGADLRHELL